LFETTRFKIKANVLKQTDLELCRWFCVSLTAVWCTWMKNLPYVDIS